MAYPDREKVKLAYDLREENPEMSANAIAKKIGVSKNTVTRWFTRPEDFDWYIDEVAVKRAIQGDLAVYDRLTVFERMEVWTKLSEGPSDREDGMWIRFGDRADRIYAAVKQWDESRYVRPRASEKPGYIARSRTRIRTPELVAKVKALRQEGLVFRDIASRLGITYDTARRAGNAA